MKFPQPLVKAKLIKRYKRFLADVEFDDGTVAVAHCANSGSMKGCAEPGSTVYLSPNTNPKAKLDWRWELVDIDGALVGINTSHPNKIVADAIEEVRIPELAGYESLRREVKYGKNSRIDILLEGEGLCYVEVKNVTLREGDAAAFPDAVTARGTKHLNELADMVAEGHRAVMVYLVQRQDCSYFTPAEDIDPVYAHTLREVLAKGVEALCYTCHMSTKEVYVDSPLEMRI